MNCRRVTRLFCLTSASLACIAGSAAFAQTVELEAAASEAPSAAEPEASGSGGMGDIVVTATRSAKFITDVPLSISAYSKESLDNKGVRDISDVTRMTPGLVLENTRNSSNISIRGINSTAGAATTGIYIDDTPVQIRTLGYGGGNAYPLIFDLERVEVLRGPQGTLFGGGSMGGTVRFITPRPGLNDVSAYGRAELSFTEGGDANYEAGVALGGPVVEDRLGVRVSGWYRRDGGYVDRRKFDTGAMVDANSNWANSYVARAALTWSPIDELKITPSLYYQKTYRNDSDYFWEHLSDRDGGSFVNGNPAQETSRDKFILPSLNVEYNFGGVDLIVVGSYFDRTQANNVDYTTFDQSLFTGQSFPTLPGQRAVSRFVNSQENYTAEARLQSSDPDTRFRWVVGGFWSRSDQVAIQQVEDTFFPIYIEQRFGVPYTDVFGQPLVDGLYIYDQLSTTRDKQIAGFGQVDWDVTDQLTLTAGLRVAKADFEINADAGGPVVGPRAIDNGSQSDSPVTPKFGITFEPDDDNLFYATVAKGFRPGGYNPAVGVPCGPQLASLGLTDRPKLFKSDSVWSYELGTKNSFFGRALQVQASVYQIDWDNIQQIVNLNSCGFRFVTNLGTVRSRGFDLQAQVKAADGLTLSAAVGYTNAKFKETVFGGPTATLAIVSDGDAVTGPPWTVTLGGEYRFTGLGDSDSYLRVDYDYRSHQDAITPTLNPANGGTDLTVPNRPATHFVSIRAGTKVGPVDLSAFVQNLLDESAWTSMQRDNTRSVLYRATTLRPRTFGLTATYRY